MGASYDRAKDLFYYRAEKLKGDKLSVAARHNKRAILNELSTSTSIDKHRSHLNYVLAGCVTPKAITNEARAMIRAAGIVKLRHDAVKAIEIVFSLPVASKVSHRDYFTDCLSWTRKTYAGAHVLAADVHLDEAAPHCHILLLPLIDGKMNGSDLMGAKPLLSARKVDFFGCVASRYGFSEPPKKASEGDLTALYRVVVEHIKVADSAAVNGIMWAFTRDAIRDNPIKAAQLLGIDFRASTPQKRARTYVEIFTSAGAGAKTEKPTFKPFKVQNQNMPATPIDTGGCDFLQVKETPALIIENMIQPTCEKTDRTLSCVGFDDLLQLHVAGFSQDSAHTQQAQESFNGAAKKVLELTARAWLENDNLPTEQIFNDTPAAKLNQTHKPILIKPPAIEPLDSFTESTTREREGSILATHWDCENGIFNLPTAKQTVKPYFDDMVSNALGERHQRN